MAILYDERQPFISPHKDKWRWFVLMSFSFLSFSSALMWITFSPCLYIFVDYYFGTVNNTTVNAINSLSSIYMMIYPLAIQFSFKYFEDRANVIGQKYFVPGNGLRRGILIGTVLNAIAGGIRWLGAFPSSYGFAILFFGQTIAALAQVFVLSTPPQLAVTWFPENEVNIATSIAVSSNNLGIAAGCALTPLLVRQSSKNTDIPNLLFLQFFMCLAVLVLIWITFNKPPAISKNTTSTIVNELNDSKEQPFKLWRKKSFIFMLVAYCIIMGAQCTVVTLLAQILIPSFKEAVNEMYIGLLGAGTLIIGFPASVLFGFYLDKTLKYRAMCTAISIVAASSLLALYFSIEVKFLTGAVISCLTFGVSSYAISPIFFQYASELFYPISEIIPTGYFFTAGNIGGVLFVAIMGWTGDEDTEKNSFPMRQPMAGLVIAMFISVGLMSQVKGELKRTAYYQYANNLPA